MLMPTSKKRLNISLSPEMDKLIRQSARRDDMPEATKAAELIKIALELEEDMVLGQMLEERLREHVPESKYISHKEAWKHLK